jgi:hypothetical protein
MKTVEPSFNTDVGNKVGAIRVKANGMLWQPEG